MTRSPWLLSKYRFISFPLTKSLKISSSGLYSKTSDSSSHLTVTLVCGMLVARRLLYLLASCLHSNKQEWEKAKTKGTRQLLFFHVLETIVSEKPRSLFLFIPREKKSEKLNIGINRIGTLNKIGFLWARKTEKELSEKQPGQRIKWPEAPAGWKGHRKCGPGHQRLWQGQQTSA